MLLWSLLGRIVHLATRLGRKALVALACEAVDLLAVLGNRLGILRLLIVKGVVLLHIEVEVLLLAGAVTLHEVHALVSFFSPGVEVESEVSVAQVPELETCGKVEANCDAKRQPPGQLHVGYIKEG